MLSVVHTASQSCCQPLKRVLQHNFTTQAVLVLACWSLSEVIRTCLHVSCILATATIGTCTCTCTCACIFTQNIFHGHGVSPSLIPRPLPDFSSLLQDKFFVSVLGTRLGEFGDISLTCDYMCVFSPIHFSVCQCCFHKECFSKACPRCIRVEERYVCFPEHHTYRIAGKFSSCMVSIVKLISLQTVKVDTFSIWDYT